MKSYHAFCTASCDRCSRKESVSVPVKVNDYGTPRMTPEPARLPEGWLRIAGRHLCVSCAAAVVRVLGATA